MASGSRGGGKILFLVLVVVAGAVFWPYVNAVYLATFKQQESLAALTKIGEGRGLAVAKYQPVSQDGKVSIWMKCDNPRDEVACYKQSTRQFFVYAQHNWRGKIVDVRVDGMGILGKPVSDDPGALTPLVTCVRVYGATLDDLLTKNQPSKSCR